MSQRDRSSEHTEKCLFVILRLFVIFRADGISETNGVRRDKGLTRGGTQDEESTCVPSEPHLDLTLHPRSLKILSFQSRFNTTPFDFVRTTTSRNTCHQPAFSTDSLRGIFQIQHRRQACREAAAGNPSALAHIDADNFPLIPPRVGPSTLPRSIGLAVPMDSEDEDEEELSDNSETAKAAGKSEQLLMALDGLRLEERSLGSSSQLRTD
ncbi:hypothetical protein FPCIR_11545 [Fusarium pseudocircinatum]|uniref:Uncharacterized protein n=1 Tax=Fusarium pseudocircinatum TaxID=56676 RepID=A0A8H5KQ93_9HYPO|nr:hypothetical protein FPCIR_11545 [Fusarium pseudocircinatum]